jgi:hypothetical protein
MRRWLALGALLAVLHACLGVRSKDTRWADVSR